MNETPPRSAIGHIPMLWLVLPQIAGYTFAPILPQTWQPITLVGCSLALLVIAYVRLQKNAKLLSWTPFYLAGAILLASGYFNWRQPPKPSFDKVAPREAEVIVKIERAVLREKEPEARRQKIGEKNVLSDIKQNSPGQGLSGVSVYATVIEAPAHLVQLQDQRLFITVDRNLEAMEDTTFIRGSYVRVRGLLELNGHPQQNESSSFQQFLYRNGYYYYLKRARVVKQVQPANAFQRWCYQQNQCLQAIAQQEAQSEQEIELARIYTAMMLGIKGAIPPEQKDNFRISGTMHLFAISGLHVGIIAATIYVLLSILRVPPVPRCLMALSVLFLYVHVTGASPSAVRAFFMAFFYWAAFGFRRKRSTVSALLASAFAVLVYDPQQLLSVGFQLSYTVVGGILLYGQPLIETMQDKWALFRFTPEDALSVVQKICRFVWRWSLGLLGISIAAFIFSTPLTVAYFQVFAPGAVLLNMILIPLATLAIIGGSISFSFGILHMSFMSIVFNHASWLLILLMTQCLEIALLITWGFGTVHSISLPLAVTCECIMFAWLLSMYFFKKQKHIAFYLGPPVILLFMGLCGSAAL